MAVWFEPPTQINYTASWDWETIDLSALIPVGAVGVLLYIINTRTAGLGDVGTARPNGATYDDTNANKQIVGQCPYYVGVSADRKVDIFGDGNADVKIYLAAYFESDEAEFLAERIDITPTSPTSDWYTVDLSAYLPAGCPAAFFDLQGRSANSILGIRHGISTDVRTINLASRHSSAVVGVHSNRTVSVYRMSGSDSKVFLLGWMKPGYASFKIDATDKSLGETDSYINMDLAAEVSGVVSGVVIEAWRSSGAVQKLYALRPDESSWDQYWCGERVFHGVRLPDNKVVEGKISDVIMDFYFQGYFGVAYVPTEECTVAIVSDVSGVIDKEDQEVEVQSQIGQWDNWETPEAIGQVQVGYDLGEEGLVTCNVGFDPLEWFSPREDGLVEARAFVRAVGASSMPPSVRGRDPAPNQTAVKRNKKVGFYVVGQTLDQVDIDSVKVKVGGVEYKNGDIEFSFTGYGDRYWIEVDHPLWGYEQTVAVQIDAKSVLGQTMQTVTYSFQTEWEGLFTRKSDPRLELFKPGDYGLQILTIQENWVRQGEQRHTQELELWYGRRMCLPYVENVEMKTLAGATNAKGKEVLDNGWLSVKVGQGPFVSMHQDTVLNLGPMFTNSKKSLFFKLSIPQGAVTIGYFILQLQFIPKMMRGYGTFPYGVGIYLADSEFVDFHPNTIIYRAYVFNESMWSQLLQSGIVTSPFYRGEDKRW